MRYTRIFMAAQTVCCFDGTTHSVILMSILSIQIHYITINVLSLTNSLLFHFEFKISSLTMKGQYVINKPKKLRNDMAI